MNIVYSVVMVVMLREFGEKKLTEKDLHVWVLEQNGAEKAVEKAKKFAMRRGGWDMGVPKSVTLISVEPKGAIDVM
jgi:hypothetical protein